MQTPQKRSIPLIAVFGMISLFTVLIACSGTGEVEDRVANLESQLAALPTPALAEVPKAISSDVKTVPVADKAEVRLPTTAVDITRDPTDLPGPIGDRGPTEVNLELEASELEGQLADGTTYNYWTFNQQVPGPMLRVRVNDTVNLTLKNMPGDFLLHSVDLHAVTGPGGGAKVTQVPPGEEATFSFKALKAGLYVYHCATPSVPHHISSGMYGMILVEPEGGLPEVDREFYVMQGELYTKQAFGEKGLVDFDHDKLMSEDPTYFVFNGASGALASDEHALRAEVGETIRIYFGVGGPNFISSFHVIGEMFDKVYAKASLVSEPLVDVQTTLVPPGGATVVEIKLEYPGTYILVDHALSRLEKGLVGLLHVEGEADPTIFQAK